MQPRFRHSFPAPHFDTIAADIRIMYMIMTIGLEAGMSLATQRLVVPITAKDKALVERKAAKAGKMSTAEFVRRAALDYEPADQEAAAELRSLLDGFDGLHANTLAQLDRTDAALDAALAHFTRDRA
jgi:hypothetical protein